MYKKDYDNDSMDTFAATTIYIYTLYYSHGRMIDLISIQVQQKFCTLEQTKYGNLKLRYTTGINTYTHIFNN